MKARCWRYGGVVPDEKLRRQLDSELVLIEELDYPGYFLTMYEIVSYCRRRDIMCQGRGSAANSAVCYCLGITAIDPVRWSLLFERFLSRERAEPPDIDLDIEHERREEVIQHVYETSTAATTPRWSATSCATARAPRCATWARRSGIPETALDRAVEAPRRCTGGVEPRRRSKSACGLNMDHRRRGGFDADSRSSRR